MLRGVLKIENANLAIIVILTVTITIKRILIQLS